jgi:predicted nucleotidyltransferase
VTAILYGSMVRGEATAISDVDILIIADHDTIADLDLYRLPPQVSPYVVEKHKLREMAYTNSVVIAAILEGILLVDNLRMMDELEELKKEIAASGGEITYRQIRYPRLYRNIPA